MRVPLHVRTRVYVDVEVYAHTPEEKANGTYIQLPSLQTRSACLPKHEDRRYCLCRDVYLHTYLRTCIYVFTTRKTDSFEGPERQ